MSPRSNERGGRPGRTWTADGPTSERRAGRGELEPARSRDLDGRRLAIRRSGRRQTGHGADEGRWPRRQPQGDVQAPGPIAGGHEGRARLGRRRRKSRLAHRPQTPGWGIGPRGRRVGPGESRSLRMPQAPDPARLELMSPSSTNNVPMRGVIERVRQGLWRTPACVFNMSSKDQPPRPAVGCQARAFQSSHGHSRATDRVAHFDR